MRKYILLLLIIIFAGCAPTYNIQPKYDKNTKALLIDDYKIENLQLINETKLIPLFVKGSIHRYEKNGKDSCYITHTSSTIQDFLNNARFEYYFTDLEKFIEKQSLLYCDLTKLNDIKFFECRNERLNLENYFIDYESDGFKRKDIIEVNKQCFIKIKEHFLKKANKDNINIKYFEIGDKKFSENSVLYTGKVIYTYESKIRAKKKKTETYDIVIATLKNDIKIFMKKYNSIRRNTLIKNFNYEKSKLKDLIINENKIKGIIFDEDFEMKIDASKTDKINKDFFPSIEKFN